MSIHDNKYKYKDKYEKYKYKYNLLKNTNNVLVGGGPDDIVFRLKRRHGQPLDIILKDNDENNPKPNFSATVNNSDLLNLIEEQFNVTVNNSDLEKYKYFYQIKGDRITPGTYCYCMLTYTDTTVGTTKVIEDYEETSEYTGKTIHYELITPTKYKLRDVMEDIVINRKNLLSNPRALSLIESIVNTPAVEGVIVDKYKNNIDWNMLMNNPSAIHLLESNIDKTNMYGMAGNKNAMHLIEKAIEAEIAKSPTTVTKLTPFVKNPNTLGLIKKYDLFNSATRNANNIMYNLCYANPNVLFIANKLNINLGLLTFLNNNGRNNPNYQFIISQLLLEHFRSASSENINPPYKQIWVDFLSKPGAVSLLVNTKESLKSLNERMMLTSNIDPAFGLFILYLLSKNESEQFEFKIQLPLSEKFKQFKQFSIEQISPGATFNVSENLPSTPNEDLLLFTGDRIKNLIRQPFVSSKMDQEIWHFILYLFETAKNVDEVRASIIRHINWKSLSKNPDPDAIELLKANLNEIDWTALSKNPHPDAIELLKAHLDEIDWTALSKNPHNDAIKLLKDNPSKINWYELSENTNTLVLDMCIEKMKPWIQLTKLRRIIRSKMRNRGNQLEQMQLVELEHMERLAMLEESGQLKLENAGQLKSKLIEWLKSEHLEQSEQLKQLEQMDQLKMQSSDMGTYNMYSVMVENLEVNPIIFEKKYRQE